MHHVHALSPARDRLTIRFPRVEGYAHRTGSTQALAGDGDDPELPRYAAHQSEGSTRDVDFWTSKPVLQCERSHLSCVVADTEERERSTALYLDTDDHVISFVKNFNLGFAIPYSHQGDTHEYLPDFLVRLRQDGREVGTLILETKGYDPAARAKIDGAQRWVAAVNADGSRGRWTYRCVRSPANVPAALQSALAELAAPLPLSWRVALSRFVEEIRKLYGSRLERVILYGSRARGDAALGSDVDVLVVLDSCDDFWAERGRISEVASRVSLDSDALISAFPTGLQEFRERQSPLLMNVRREGKKVS